MVPLQKLFTSNYQLKPIVFSKYLPARNASLWLRWCFGKNSRTPSLIVFWRAPSNHWWWCFAQKLSNSIFDNMFHWKFPLLVFWRAPSDHWWWWPAVGARAAGAFQSPPLLPTPPISPRWVWTFLDICFCFNIAFSTFLLIYPSQRQNLLPTLEILIKIFENFQFFKIFEKKF